MLVNVTYVKSVSLIFLKLAFLRQVCAITPPHSVLKTLAPEHFLHHCTTFKLAKHRGRLRLKEWLVLLLQKWNYHAKHKNKNNTTNPVALHYRSRAFEGVCIFVQEHFFVFRSAFSSQTYKRWGRRVNKAKGLFLTVFSKWTNADECLTMLGIIWRL